MSLVNQRNKWKKEFEEGSFDEPFLLNLYKLNRNSELWRSTYIMEHLCEYTMHLQRLLEEKG